MAETKEAINQRINSLLLSFRAEGIINGQFCFVRELDEHRHNPTSFLHLIAKFLSDSQVTLGDMTSALNQTVIDYHRLSELCIKIKGATLNMGAHAMSVAVNDFHQVVTKRLSRQRCIEALDVIKLECLTFDSRLGEFVELQRRLINSLAQ